MATLSQLIASHRRVLVIDAASSWVQVGWIGEAGGAWAHSTEEAGVAVFSLIETLGRPLTDADAFVYCDGPGSILGIRTVAAAIRTWRVLRPTPVYAYCSLALVAEVEGDAETAVIADARREMWHLQNKGESLRRVPASALTGRIVTPENFRNWSPLPAGTRLVPYSIEGLLRQIADADLFRPTEEPDAFLHEEPSYVTWTPQIHRAPSS